MTALAEMRLIECLANTVTDDETLHTHGIIPSARAFGLRFHVLVRRGEWAFAARLPVCSATVFTGIACRGVAGALTDKREISRRFGRIVGE
jgi:hypothetical protein